VSSVSEGIIKRLTLARYLFHLASDHASLHRSVAAYACINLLQDALEIFLVAAAEHVQAPISQRTDFPQYLDMINAKLSPNELPFRARLLEINRIRINSKHHAIAPNPTELTAYVKNACDFFNQACTQVFGRDFWTISLAILLNDGEKKELMTEAERAFEEDRFADCLIACRKVLFLEFETFYDIQRRMRSKAPRHTWDREWQEKNVREPFDCIVIDRSRLDADLLREGIDNGIFWNIRRLTPEVYRPRTVKKAWAIKQDPNKLDDKVAQEHAAYVLENTIDLILKTEANKRAMRSVQSQFIYTVTLLAERTPLYRKADRTGEVVCLTPAGMTRLEAGYATQGLKDEDIYWKVTYKEGGENGPWRDGYVLASDVSDD
jgi:hypothetical protein